MLQFGLAYLERGYALLVYDGPGQGQVIRQPPHMPFYGAWEKVLAKILDYVVTNFKSIVQVDNIIQEGALCITALADNSCFALMYHAYCFAMLYKARFSECNTLQLYVSP